MTAREFAAILLRVLGIYLCMDAVSALLSAASYAHASASPQSLTGQTHWPLVAVYVVGAVVYLTVGAYLVLGTQRVLRWGFSDLPTPSAEPNTFSNQAVGFSVVGLFLAAPAAADIIVPLLNAAVVFRGGHLAEASQVVLGDPWALRSGVRLVIGLGLFFGARGLAAFWHRIQPIPRVSRSAP